MNRSFKLFVVLVVILQSCNTRPNLNEDNYSDYRKKGNEISNLAQATLLANVGKAIQTGGPEYAVEFCNLKASGIVDSLNTVYQSHISRVSALNRNPENQLSSETDRELWELFENNTQLDTVVQFDNKIMYYKRINTAMPACLKCHGVPGTDINAATAEKLQALYPNDKAQGYHLNDFRGLWKIELPLIAD